MTFAAVVNRHCDDFKVAELSADNFKCVIFVQGLVLAKDAEIRQRILNKLQNELNPTLQQVAKYCQQYTSVKQDFKKLNNLVFCRSGSYAIKNRPSHLQKEISQTKQILPINQKISKRNCNLILVLDWYREFTFRNKKCDICKYVRHKGSHC